MMYGIGTDALYVLVPSDSLREPLQRVYAITFPDPKMLKEYQHREWRVCDLGSTAVLGFPVSC